MPQGLLIFLQTLAYAGVGAVLLCLAYRIFDRLTPGDLHAQIFEERNQAATTLAAGYLLGLAIVIAASIAG